MPSNIVRTPEDRAIWQRAKAAVRKQYPDIPEGDERFYKLTTAIFEKMGGSTTGEFPDEQAPVRKAFGWLHVPVSMLKAEGDRGGPGSHGGKYYFNERGHVVYGERPTGRIQHSFRDISAHGRTRSGHTVPKMLDQGAQPDRNRFAVHPAIERWTSDDHDDAAKIHERAKRELWRTGANMFGSWDTPGATGADRAAHYHGNMEKLHRARRDELRRRDKARFDREVATPAGDRQLAEEHHVLMVNPHNKEVPRTRVFGRTAQELQAKVSDWTKRGYQPVAGTHHEPTTIDRQPHEVRVVKSALFAVTPTGRILVKADVKNPGSRGGKGYWDDKGQWQYGERPAGMHSRQPFRIVTHDAHGTPRSGVRFASSGPEAAHREATEVHARERHAVWSVEPIAPPHWAHERQGTIGRHLRSGVATQDIVGFARKGERLHVHEMPQPFRGHVLATDAGDLLPVGPDDAQRLVPHDTRQAAAPPATTLAVGRTILDQLGGNKFLAMTGAKNLMGGKNDLQFHLPKNVATRGINAVRIELDPDDTYTMRLYKIGPGATIKEVATDADLHADQLRERFTYHTGLDTSLGTMQAGGTTKKSLFTVTPTAHILVKADTPEEKAELIAEHKRLVKVLRSASHADDKAEARKQADELKEYEEEVRRRTKRRKDDDDEDEDDDEDDDDADEKQPRASKPQAA